MNPHWHNLIAFLAVLFGIVMLTLNGKAQDAVVVGLVGVLGTFRPWGMGLGASGKSDDPVNIKETDA
jgi:hypothetical protein